MSENIIVYDLETKKTFDEVGGRGNFDQANHHLLEVSFLGLYSYSQGKYFGFKEDELPILEKIFIAEKPLLIGFNSISFDNRVLQPYFKHCKISDLPQLDILAEIYKVLGFRIKLDNVAKATLGMGKSGSGLDAIKYFRTGNMEALAKYCMDDVRITKDVYEYGLNHGLLWYPSGGDILSIKIPWGKPPFVRELLYEALEKHIQISIRYWQVVEDQADSKVSECIIDVKQIHGQKVVAFCDVSHKEETFEMRSILSAKLTNTKFAHQTSLI